MSAIGGTIALVSPRYAPEIGGVERVVEMTARGLARRGVDVEVITTDPTGRLPRLEQRDGVTVRRFRTLANDDVYSVFARARVLAAPACRALRAAARPLVSHAAAVPGGADHPTGRFAVGGHPPLPRHRPLATCGGRCTGHIARSAAGRCGRRRGSPASRRWSAA